MADKQRTNLKMLGGLVLLVVMLAGAAWLWQQQHIREQIPTDDPVLASINGHSITRRQFIDEMARRGGKLPGQYQTVEQRKALLDVMVERRAMLMAATAAGYEKDPLIVRQIENMMISKLTQDRINDRLAALDVDDDEIEGFYASHKQEYDKPARRQVAMIKIAVSSKAAEQAREKARQRMDEVLEEVKQLDPKILHFGSVAREYSEERSSRYRGGVIGWLVDHSAMHYKWEKEVTEAAFGLEDVGEISPVVETEQGLYLLRLVANKPAQQQPLASLHDGIHRRLLLEKRKQEKQRIIAELQNGLKVDVNEQLLKEIAPISGQAKLIANTPPAMP